VGPEGYVERLSKFIYARHDHKNEPGDEQVAVSTVRSRRERRGVRRNAVEKNRPPEK
jgi:hypothetical protein